jgi:hypothetical protein
VLHAAPSWLLYGTSRMIEPGIISTQRPLLICPQFYGSTDPRIGQESPKKAPLPPPQYSTDPGYCRQARGMVQSFLTNGVDL